MRNKVKGREKDSNFLLINTFTKMLKNNGEQNTIKIRNLKSEV